MTATLLTLALKLLKSPLAIAAGIGLVVGLYLGRAIWQCPAPVQETYAPAARQADSSLVLERTPDPTAKPAAIAPKGGTVERVVEVTVAPRLSGPAARDRDSVRASPNKIGDLSPRDSSVGLQPPPCPALHVELALIRMKDGSRRVTASSPAGRILGGVDIPVEGARPPATPRRWVAGPLVSIDWRQWGAYLARDVGPLQLVVLSPPAPWGTQRSLAVGVGLRF